ncbi:uncharacterized protein LOC126964832 [Leptidea sinapis]|uniref:uncharacterized protein LOC126964832 n=1 Tax=Leptidea sinapis TaxID=189913 RepID=UPI002140C1D0|nr:uncharacterized protein LOC126964832 [Leptidea sinapis]
MMSVRNYLSAREKSELTSFVDYLPLRKQHKNTRPSQLPVLSANPDSIHNRNLVYPIDHHYLGNKFERSSSPLSDFFSESEIGTPDFLSEESDSSAGSELRRNTAEATRILAEEWERIERTLYKEEGEKCTRPQMIEECKQWQELHLHLRVVGKGLPGPEKQLYFRQISNEEVIALNYNNYEQYSESEERLSQSSADVTPTNSPRTSSSGDYEPTLCREKFSHKMNTDEISDRFSSLLHISSLQIRSPLPRRKQNQSVLRSEVASSRWMRSSRPESSINLGRNSAKSYISFDTRNLNINSTECNTLRKGVFTARNSEPPNHQMYATDIHNGMFARTNLRKISLPPLMLEEEKRILVSSAKKQKQRKLNSRLYQANPKK